MVKPQNFRREPHYKVRLGFGNWTYHVASWTQPVVRIGADGAIDVELDVIEDHRYGDTIGYVDWSALKTITWRWSSETMSRSGPVQSGIEGINKPTQRVTAPPTA